MHWLETEILSRSLRSNYLSHWIIWVFISQYLIEICCQGSRIQWQLATLDYQRQCLATEFPLNKLARDWDFFFLRLIFCSPILLPLQTNPKSFIWKRLRLQEGSSQRLWKVNLGQSFQYSIKGITLDSIDTISMNCWQWLGCSQSPLQDSSRTLEI